MFGNNWQPEHPVSPTERTIIDRELRLGLYSIRYEDFERAIVKYGYTGRLTDQIFEHIAPDINMEVGSLTDKQSAFHYYYQS